MKQERLVKSSKFIEGVIERAERAPVKLQRGSGKDARYIEAMSKRTLQIFKPIRHALNKAIEKPERKDGNRALCPDCGTTVRKNDNYCRICGQRLKTREPEKKSFYEEFERKNNRRQIKAKRGQRK